MNKLKTLERRRLIYLKEKRFLDVVVSSIGVVLILPVVPIISIAIKLDSKGPVIFKQERLGKNGKVFEIYKFRSMVDGAENMGTPYTVEGDSRITKVGHFIRDTSIDELPQFVNILKGDMSLIGPRPLMPNDPYSYEEYSKENLKRFEVRPGLTGLAQINGRKNLDLKKQFEYDVKYVELISFSLDFRIFLKTFAVILTQKDNY